MSFAPPQGSWPVRQLKKIPRAAIVLTLYCWIAKAVYLWGSSDFYPHVGDLARPYLAARDSLQQLPDTILTVLSYCRDAIAWAYWSLANQLGYEPFTLPETTVLSVGSIPLFNGGAVLEWPVFSLASPPVQALATTFIGISVVQFAILFTLSAFGITINWRRATHPYILDAGLRIGYTIALLVAAFLLVGQAFSAGIWSGVASFTAALVALRWPVVAGLSLFILFAFRLHPAALIRFPIHLLTMVIRGSKPTAHKEGSDEKEPHNAKETGSKRKTFWKKDTAQGTNKAPPPAVSDALDRYHSACRTFDLEPDEFSQDELVQRYRALTRKLHPDTKDGSEFLMKRLNQDYEYILNHKGWKR